MLGPFWSFQGPSIDYFWLFQVPKRAPFWRFQGPENLKSLFGVFRSLKLKTLAVSGGRLFFYFFCLKLNYNPLTESGL